MSTPNPVTFPPLTKGFSWTPSTTGDGGAALAPGESQSGSTVGIRADGDTSHSPGNYQYLIIVTGVAAQLLVGDAPWVNAKIPPGNYWADVDQTDSLNGATATSKWSGTEAAFSIPQPIVQPSPPTGFTAA